MNLQEAINHPRVNVFDIVHLRSNKFDVYTYRKPGETLKELTERNYKNLNKAIQLIKSCK